MIYDLEEKNEIPEIDTSSFKNNLNKTIDFIQNVCKYWVSGNIDVKRKIQRLVFPGGLFINPYNRQYLTPEINYLFRTTSELSRVSENVKKIPHWFK
jgi:site-specific DNA recombinase